MNEVEKLQEIIKVLRKEISDLIKENDFLKNRVIDLEIINHSHQDLVGDLIKKDKEGNNEKEKAR